LKAKTRDGSGKGAARKLRADGLVPAVLYGEKKGSRLLSLEERELDALFRHHGLGSHLVDLDVEGEAGGPALVLIREIQQHPSRRTLLHLDLQHVSATKKIHLTVPVALKGEPAGVKTGGGVLELLARELEIQCLPDNIPSEIEVDVTALEIGDSVHVSDLALSDLTILNSPETAVATVVRPTVVSEPSAEAGKEAAEGEAAEGEAAPEGEAPAPETPSGD